MISNQTAEQIGLLLYTLFRDVVEDALKKQPPSPSNISYDRIGGMEIFTEVTGMASQTGYNLTSRGKVPYAKRGGKLIFSEKELREWLTENHHPVVDSADKNLKFVIAPTIRKKGGRKQ